MTKRPNVLIFIAIFMIIILGFPPYGIAALFTDRWEPSNFYLPIMLFAIITCILLVISYRTWDKSGKTIILILIGFGIANLVGCVEIWNGLASIK
jgi:hypothetical protein